ncbi:hypothetical protein STAS_32706 [Striga asiatica]|uniref:Uncharacterized protein n=1 Tax=Striga asiatica TaxID=4170 RepID=A0A5A7RBR1_STRAF|nr:hypothetical protein STAS_32706 [Striga asiatica]
MAFIKDTTYSRVKLNFMQIQKDFADVLLSFLTLPFENLRKILVEHYGDSRPIVGKLTTLYNGLVYFNFIHYQIESHTHMLLNQELCFETKRLISYFTFRGRFVFGLCYIFFARRAPVTDSSD